MLLPEKVRYWKCVNPHSSDEKWVVLLHSWGRNSARMVSRGEVYWNRGYSILFVDAYSHGQTRYYYTSTALWFAEHAHKICVNEGIQNPILHGLSFGSIASTIFSAHWGSRALVAEALPNNIKGTFYGFLRVLHIPTWLYSWEIFLLFHSGFPWQKVEPANNLPKIKVPIFLIHGENDSMFPIETHFKRNLELIKPTDFNWVVSGSPHSKMGRNINYNSKLNEFIDYVENEF